MEDLMTGKIVKYLSALERDAEINKWLVQVLDMNRRLEDRVAALEVEVEMLRKEQAHGC